MDHPCLHLLCCLTGEGIEAFWDTVRAFEKNTRASGVFEAFRREQTVKWVHDMVNEHLTTRFLKHPGVKEALPGVESRVAAGDQTPVAAVNQLLEVFYETSGSQGPG